MKKITFLLLPLFFIIYGCSDNNDTNPNVASQLKKTVETLYDQSQEGTVAGQKMVTEFENGRPVLMSIYLYNGYFNAYYQYTYNTSGYLSGLLFHYNTTDEETLTTFTYDLQGRLTQALATHSDGNIGYNNYVYDGATVTNTYTYPSENFTDVTIYHLNENNTVQQQIFDGLTTDFVYDSYSVIAMNQTQANGSTNNLSYTYDQAHDPSLISTQSIAGTYRANYYFLNQYLYFADATTLGQAEKYPIHWLNESAGAGGDILYEFNAAGLPLSRKVIEDNNLTAELIYIYE